MRENKGALLIFIVILTVIMLGTPVAGDGIAAFTADITDGPYPLSVQFTDQSTITPPLTYLWNFGDGSPPATDQNPVHIYQESGMFTVSLTVTNNAGGSSATREDYIGVTASQSNAYMITSTAGSHGVISPSGAVPVNPGDNHSFLLIPNVGYHIDELLVDGVAKPATPLYTFSNVNSDHSISVSFTPETGSLIVSSNPNGASIFVDGVNLGTTPKTVDVSVGTHQLWLTLLGYDTYASTISIEKDKTTTIPMVNLVRSVRLQTIYPGKDVFIGEQGLTLVNVATGTQLSWYTGTQIVGASAPAATVTVSDPTNFYVSPTDFVGRTGNWYIGSTSIVAIVVNDPSQAVSVYDQQTGKTVTGKSVLAGDFLIFRLQTNLNVIPGERGSGATGFMAIKVRAPDGTVYSYLHQDTTTNQSLLNQAPNAMPYYWNNIPLVLNSQKGWATGFLGSNNARTYPDGSYTFWTECNLNGMMDNYKDASGNDYIGKTVSAVQTVTISSTLPPTPPPTPVPIIQNIYPGQDVFIGEQGLKLINVTAGTQLSWYTGTQIVGASAPAATVTVGNPSSFYVSPTDFIGRTGNWYIGSTDLVGIIVNDPSQSVRVYDQQTGKEVTGKSIPAGDFLNFRIETNLAVIPAERRSGTTGFMNIKVKAPDGTVHSYLHQDTTINQSLLNQAPNTMPYYWNNIPLLLNSHQGWATGFLGSNNARTYPDGSYTFWTECNLNGMMDNYKDASGNDYIGKTISAVQTVTISSTLPPPPTPTPAPIIQNIYPGKDVFIGEQGLKLIGVTPGTQLSWYTGTQIVGASAPAATVTVSDPTNFYVSPTDFVGRTGNWYIGTSSEVGIVVNDPSQNVKVYDQQTGKDVTGKSILTGDFLNFRIETNLAVIPAERNSGTTGFMNIKVRAPDGTVYSYLHQDTAINQSLLNQSPNAMPYYWNNIPLVLNSHQGWATGFLGPNNARTYPDGSYTFWTECNLNGMMDNYKDASGNDYIGKTVSAVHTVIIPSDVPTDTTGSISMNSNPNGAQIYLDGNSTDHNTPFTLIGISAGQHVVMLKLAGYQDFSQTVTVISRQTTIVNTTLNSISPIAIFTANTTVGSYPLSVQFTDLSTGAPTITYQWSFGDGSPSVTEKHPVHVYQSAGLFSVNLIVTNSAGNSTLTRPDYINVTMPQPSDYNLNLGEGWNLVSVPKKLAPGYDTGSIFKDVDTEGRTIWEYDGVAHNWVPINANTSVLPLYGFWIYSKSPTTIPLKYDPNPLQIPPTRHLVQGWNLIGFSGTIPASARDTLISVRNIWTQAMAFDATAYKYEVQIINGGSGQYNDSRMMNPTKGYWLFMTGPGDLSAIGV